jgi:hypothetical protein
MALAKPWCHYYTPDHTGSITISGQTSPENLRKAIAALDAEIGKFDDPSYFDAVELEAVKAHRAVTSAFDRERIRICSYIVPAEVASPRVIHGAR